MTHDQTLLLVAGPIAAVGFALPWLGHEHQGILFGVSVPKAFTRSPEARRSVAAYRRDCVLWALVLLGIAWLAVRLGGDTAWLLLAISAAGVPLELIGCFYLWHREHVRLARLRGKLAQLDAQEGSATPAEDNGLATPDRPVGALLVATAAFAPLIAAALYLETHYNALPAAFPVHWNLAGQPNAWGDRTPATVFMPPILGGGVVLLLVALTLLVGFAPGPESRHRMRSLAPMAALCWLLSVIFTVVSLLPALNIVAIHGGLFGAIILLASLAIVVWLMVRTAHALPGAVPLHAAPPQNHWRAGIFYFDPNDRSVLVPKRFGWGWTLNFARPASWVVMLCLLLCASAMVWLPHLLH